jgi:hypothetical protein
MPQKMSGMSQSLGMQAMSKLTCAVALLIYIWEISKLPFYSEEKLNIKSTLTTKQLLFRRHTACKLTKTVHIQFGSPVRKITK